MNMRVITVLLLSCLVAVGLCQKAPQAVVITVRFLHTVSPIDTMKIKAIGSAQTKAVPTVLKVQPAEAARVEKMIIAAGGSLASAPVVRTLSGELAAVSMLDGSGAGEKIDITPINKNNSVTTLNYKLSLISISGTRRTTRSATGMARVEEDRKLLIIVNPRAGETGFVAVVTCVRMRE